MRTNLMTLVAATAAFLLGGCGAAAPSDPGAAPEVVVTGAGGTIAIDGGVAVVEGPAGKTGTMGTAGAMGAAGSAGSAGLQGPAGPAGIEGPAGPQGPPGANTGLVGPPGPQGPSGAVGSQGPQGAPGATGAAGATGPQGPATGWTKANLYEVQVSNGIQPATTAVVTVPCGSVKDIVLTGGCNNGGLNIWTESRPINSTNSTVESGWSCTAYNQVSQITTLTAYAVCVKVP
jgi:hypothetical protein